MRSRRKFLNDSLFLSGGVMVGLPTLSQLGFPGDRSRQLTVLHTNDTHSHIDPFSAADAKYPNRGGVVNRAKWIEEIRREQKNVLLLDAGDIFQGTPYFNKYGGVLEMKLMEALKYDAATMGNHDFDGGITGFVHAQKQVTFPFLCANYDFSNTLLDGLTKSHHIFTKDGLKIGVFGLGVELDGLVPKTKYEDTIYNDPIAIAQDQVRELEKENCDLIICLSHLGYNYEDKRKVSDHLLAQNTRGIHLIIGGHTHTFLEKPTVLKNKEGENVLINQVGWAGIQLGRIDFTFEKSLTSKSSLLEV